MSGPDELDQWRDDELVRALRAPGTAHELADQERYVAAFRASRTPRGNVSPAAGVRRLGAGRTTVVAVVALSSGGPRRRTPGTCPTRSSASCTTCSALPPRGPAGGRPLRRSSATSPRRDPATDGRRPVPTSAPTASPTQRAASAAPAGTVLDADCSTHVGAHRGTHGSAHGGTHDRAHRRPTTPPNTDREPTTPRPTAPPPPRNRRPSRCPGTSHRATPARR